MAMLLKVMYKFSAILIKIPIHRNRKDNPKIYMEAQKTPKEKQS
jgi:hypothetical protein